MAAEQPGGGRQGIGPGLLVVFALILLALSFASLVPYGLGKMLIAINGQGDPFVAAGAVFSGLAFGALATAVIVQWRHLPEQNNFLAKQLGFMARSQRQMQISDANDQLNVYLQIILPALQDPDLLDVLDTYDGRVDTVRRKQYQYAHLLYMQVLRAYEIGSQPGERGGRGEAEIRGHLRVLCRNSIFRAYWEATRPHRDTLVTGTPEAKLRFITDEIVRRYGIDNGN